MIRNIFGTIVIFSIVCAGNLEAGIVFEFGNGGQSGMDVDGAMSRTTTVMGLTATVSTNSGVLNQGSSFFGINSAETNETTRIDDDSVDEVLTISFGQDVFVNYFETSEGNSATTGSFTVGASEGIFSQLATNETVRTSFGSPGALLLAGQTFTIQQDSGASGFSFDRIKVSIVPEPSTLTMFASAVAFCFLGRRRQRIQLG